MPPQELLVAGVPQCGELALHHDAGSFGHLEFRFGLLAQFGAAIVFLNAHHPARIADQETFARKGFDLWLNEQFVDIPHGSTRIGIGGAICKDKNGGGGGGAPVFSYFLLSLTSTIMGKNKDNRI